MRDRSMSFLEIEEEEILCSGPSRMTNQKKIIYDHFEYECPSIRLPEDYCLLLR